MNGAYMGVDHLFHCRTRDKRSLTMEFMTRCLKNKSEGVCVRPVGLKVCISLQVVKGLKSFNQLGRDS